VRFTILRRNVFQHCRRILIRWSEIFKLWRQRGPLIDGSQKSLVDAPYGEKRSRTIWQSKDKYRGVAILATGEAFVYGPGLFQIFNISLDELRDLEYALNQFFEGSK